MASSSSGQNELIFIQSKRGKPKLLRAGHQFTYHMANGDKSTIWRCVKRDICNGSITLNSNFDTIIRERQHICVPDFHKNNVDVCLETCKKRVVSEFKAVSKIYEESFEVLDTSDSDGPDIPDFRSKSDALYNRRKSAFQAPSKFNQVDKVKFPKILTDNFLLYERSDENDFFIFGTNLGLDLMQRTDLVLGDGTFSTVPRPFYQLRVYSLHVDTGSTKESTSIMPVLFCLLTNKHQSTYQKLFTVLKEKLKLNITFFKCDYEVAVVNAVKEVFPNVQVKGCFFHLKQAIFKKANELGMLEPINKQDCQKQKALKKLVLMASNLALLPQCYIPEAWSTIVQKAPECDESQKFIKYFTDQWIKKINADMWCCAQERHRTTNAIERWHRTLKLKATAEKGNLYYFVKVLKSEAIKYNKKYKKEEVCSATPKRRRTGDILKDSKIEKIIEDLQKEKISIETCLMKLSWTK